MDALLTAAVLLGAAAGTALVVRNPAFWVGLGREILRRLLPGIVKAMAPRDFTPEERARMDRGEQPLTPGNGPHNRFGRQKGE